MSEQPWVPSTNWYDLSIPGTKEVDAIITDLLDHVSMVEFVAVSSEEYRE